MLEAKQFQTTSISETSGVPLVLNQDCAAVAGDLQPLLAKLIDPKKVKVY